MNNYDDKIISAMLTLIVCLLGLAMIAFAVAIPLHFIMRSGEPPIQLSRREFTCVDSSRTVVSGMIHAGKTLIPTTRTEMVCNQWIRIK